MWHEPRARFLPSLNGAATPAPGQFGSGIASFFGPDTLLSSENLVGILSNALAQGRIGPQPISTAPQMVGKPTRVSIARYIESQCKRTGAVDRTERADPNDPAASRLIAPQLNAPQTTVPSYGSRYPTVPPVAAAGEVGYDLGDIMKLIHLVSNGKQAG